MYFIIHLCTGEYFMYFIAKYHDRRKAIYFFLIQFNVPFNIISLIETSQSIGGAKREYSGKTT